MDNEIENIDKILELKEQKMSNVEIGKNLNISESAVRRRIKKFQDRIN